MDDSDSKKRYSELAAEENELNKKKRKIRDEMRKFEKEEEARRIKESEKKREERVPSGTVIGYGEFNGTMFVIWDAVVFIYNWCCYRNKYELRRPATPEEIRYQYSVDHEGATTPKEYVKLKLGPELFQEFMKGNLTNELKKKLFDLREQRGAPLSDYIQVAEELHNLYLAAWIKNISYTTLQDEGIV